MRILFKSYGVASAFIFVVTFLAFSFTPSTSYAVIIKKEANNDVSGHTPGGFPNLSVSAISSPSNSKASHSPLRFIVKFKDSKQFSLDECAEDLLEGKKSFKNALKSKSSTIDQLNVKFKVTKGKSLFRDCKGLKAADIKNNQQQIVAKLKSKKFAQGKGFKNLPVPDISNAYVFEVSPGVDVLEAAGEYSKDPNIEYAHPDYAVQALLIPNDPYYASSGSWGQPYDDLWGLKKMQIDQAWNIARGTGVVVAVVDTGLDYNHPDILGNVWSNVNEIPGNGMDDDNNGRIDDIRGWDFTGNDNDPMDGHGHGTHVSGTIAAVDNNGIGIAGVAPDAMIMAVKGLDDQGSGTVSGLADALIYSAENGADVINNSWSCGNCPSVPLLEDAVRYANSLGSVVIFAAGNSNADSIHSSPQNIPESIVVASSDEFDTKSSFSNFGSKVDFSAPGGGSTNLSSSNKTYNNILSLRANGTDMYGDGHAIVGQDYLRARGTSMAAPHASGLAALLVEAFPSNTVDEIRARMISTVDPYSVTPAVSLGSGRINAYKALTAAPAPLIKVSGFHLQEMVGDGDNIPESGEEFSLHVGLKNLWENAADVHAAITLKNSVDLAFANANSNYGGINTGVTVTNDQNPFILRLGQINSDSPADFQLQINADNVPQQESFTIDTGVAPLTVLPSYTNDMKIDGDYIAFYGSYGAGGHAYLYNWKTSQTTILSYNPNDTWESGSWPRISGNHVIWGQGKRGWITDLTVYNITTGIKQVINTSPGSLLGIDILNTKIVWSEKRFGNYDIFMYDLSTSQEIQITADPSDQIFPVLAENHVVWKDLRNVTVPNPSLSICDFYALDLRTGNERRLTSQPTVTWYYDASPDYVVFPQADRTFGNWDIHMINLESNQETVIADGPSEQAFAAISGDKVVYQDNISGDYEIYLYDISTKAKAQVTNKPGSWQVIPDIDQSNLIWIDRRNSRDEIYLANAPITNQSVDLLTPKPGQVLDTPLVNFSWTRGGGGPYGIHIGSNFNTSDDIYSNGSLQQTSLVVDSPKFMSGQPVYVKLVSQEGAATVEKEYTFQTGGLFEPAEMISPAPGTLLPITAQSSPTPYSRVNFQWDPGIGATKYWLRVVGKGGWQLFPNLTTTTQTVIVNLDGDPVVVELWSFVNQEWVKREYTYQTNYPPELQPIYNLLISPGAFSNVRIAAIDPNGVTCKETLSANVQPNTLNYTFQPSCGAGYFTIDTSNSVGNWAVTVTAKDQQGMSDSETFFVTIRNWNASNNLPVIQSLSNRIVKANNQLVFYVRGSDADKDPLNYYFSNLPLGATLKTVLVGDFNFDGIVDNADVSMLSMKYGSSDMLYDLDSDQVVNAQDLVVMQQNISKTATTIDALRWGLFQWAPTVSDIGQHQLNFYVSDGSWSQVFVSNMITVNPPNQQPVLDQITTSVEFCMQTTSNATTGLNLWASDPDGDNPLIFDFSPKINGASLGVYSYNQSLGKHVQKLWWPTTAPGDWDVTQSVSDGNGGTDQNTFHITVNNLPTINISISKPKILVNNGQATITVSANSPNAMSSVWWYVYDKSNPSADVFGKVNGVSKNLKDPQDSGSCSGQTGACNYSRTITINRAGTFEIGTELRDVGACPQVSATRVPLSVYNPPTVSVAASSQTVSVGGPTTINVSGASSNVLTSVWWNIVDKSNPTAKVMGTVNGKSVDLKNAQNFGSCNGKLNCSYSKTVTIGRKGTFEVKSYLRDVMYPPDPQVTSTAVPLTVQ